MVRAAITSGITNDLGSGSNVDCCCITKGKVRSRLGFSAQKKAILGEEKKKGLPYGAGGDVSQHRSVGAQVEDACRLPLQPRHHR